jgi:30S ribosomal protein S31
MGKGDRRSKRGKIYRGTYGARRPRKKKRATQQTTQQKPAAPAR